MLKTELSHVQVYDAKQESKPVDSFEHGARAPQDMAACSLTKNIYIADKNRILRYTPRKTVTKWIEIAALTISVRNGRLLVTTEHKGLYIYGQKGEKIKHVKLLDCMMPLHAVETTAGGCIIGTKGGLCEYDSHGKALRSFQFCFPTISVDEYPRHMVLDSDGNLLMAGDTTVCAFATAFELRSIMAIPFKCKLGRICYFKEAGIEYITIADQSGDICMNPDGSYFRSDLVLTYKLIRSAE